ncbi:hypothetical protein LPICM02_160023 [Pseudolactococcus piscium]|nr:hypothetical protein LPICM02_160023 [Lactococcus piscium]
MAHSNKKTLFYKGFLTYCNVPRRNRTSIKPLGGARNIRYTRGTVVVCQPLNIISF